MSTATIQELEPKTIKTIQELIQINLDSAQGFEDASTKITNRDRIELFMVFAEQHRTNAMRLKEIVKLNDEEPIEEGSYAAAMHRAWLNVRSTLNGNDPHVVFVEAERGEAAISDAYKAAVNETLASPVHDLLLAQYDFVRKCHSRIMEIRDVLARK